VAANVGLKQTGFSQQTKNLKNTKYQKHKISKTQKAFLIAQKGFC
jgi:hypothetical protein